MTSPVFLSGTIYLRFGTSSAVTGAATNADSPPVVTVAEDGVDMGYVPPVTNLATGLYQVAIACTAGNGFSAGSRYLASVTAVVGGVTGRDGIGEWEVLAVDLNTGVASVTGLTAANLDVAVSSRLATAGYTAPDNAGIAAIGVLTATTLDAAVSSRMATYVQPTGFLSAVFPAGTVASTTNITAGTISLDATEAGYLKDTWQLHGLDIPNPLLVSATARTVGTIEQTIGTAGGTTTVTRTA